MITFAKPTFKEGSLKVWHIPQVPMHPFVVYVDTIQEGKAVMDLLARYDDFQFKNHIKPDYSNVSGLSVLEEDTPIDTDELNANIKEGLPPGMCWIEVEASLLAMEWEDLKNEDDD